MPGSLSALPWASRRWRSAPNPGRTHSRVGMGTRRERSSHLCKVGVDDLLKAIGECGHQREITFTASRAKSPFDSFPGKE